MSAWDGGQQVRVLHVAYDTRAAADRVWKQAKTQAGQADHDFRPHVHSNGLPWLVWHSHGDQTVHARRSWNQACIAMAMGYRTDMTRSWWSEYVSRQTKIAGMMSTAKIAAAR
eukprot:1154054-Pelagomonas_calceolata.AAC.6